MSTDDKWIDELVENYGGNAPIGEYRHTYNCPDRSLEAPSCLCMTPEEFNQSIQKQLKRAEMRGRAEAKEELKKAWRSLKAAIIASANDLDRPFINAPNQSPWTIIKTRMANLEVELSKDQEGEG